MSDSQRALSRARRLYLALIGVALVAMFAGSWWPLHGRGIPIVGNVIHVPVLAFVAAAVVGLLWLRPRRTIYILGAVCVLLAFIGLWLASPLGGQWLGEELKDPNYGRYGRDMFAYLVLLLPVGWVVLGASVADWKLCLATYLAPGVVLVLSIVLMGGTLGPPWVPAYFLFGWPVVFLVLLGTFGYSFG